MTKRTSKKTSRRPADVTPKGIVRFFEVCGVTTDGGLQMITGPQPPSYEIVKRKDVAQEIIDIWIKHMVGAAFIMVGPDDAVHLYLNGDIELIDVKTADVGELVVSGKSRRLVIMSRVMIKARELEQELQLVVLEDDPQDILGTPSNIVPLDSQMRLLG